MDYSCLSRPREMGARKTLMNPLSSIGTAAILVFGPVYADPETDLSGYERLLLMDAQFAFRSGR